ncbi:hypothetical protein HRbin39_01781 [bacterium HR39]|nr:hypothetical protein HRbin39_01781 [bacterium HR39]
MREIVRDILASPVPVAGWVGPAGARAASAGAYILMATHIAAMAPGTAVGAATPVALGGPGTPPPDGNGGDGGKGKDGGDAGGEEGPRRPGLMDKALEDAAAYMRSLARLRGRNVEWAERFVREAKSLSAEEAVELGVADLPAPSIEELLAAIDGRRVKMDGREVVLGTAGMAVVAVEPDWRTRLLAILTNPNVAYLLLLIGIYGIVLEFYSPGLTGPGLVGAISLLLALYALAILPVSYVGLALVLLGAALLVAELFIGSFGVLGVAGIVSLAAGGLLLFEEDVPGFAVSLWLVTGVAGGGGALLLAAGWMVAKSRLRRVEIGPERIVHARATVLSWHEGEGEVRFEGEVWQARGPRELALGTEVEVVGREGLVLEVRPVAREEGRP